MTEHYDVIIVGSAADGYQADVAYQAGTCRFGDDPVNPALTAMANAIRVGDHLLQRLGGG